MGRPSTSVPPTDARAVELADDYAAALTAIQRNAERTLDRAMQRSLLAILDELARAYRRFLEASTPAELGDLGGRRTGAAVIEIASERFQAVLAAAKGFMSPGEMAEWREAFALDLQAAVSLGEELGDKLVGLAQSGAQRAEASGISIAAVRIAAQTASAYIEAENARFRSRIAEITAQGVANGWNSRRLVKQVREALKGATDPRGITARMGPARRAMLIARSELANAYVAAQVKTATDQGFEYVRWIATADERVCPVCASRHGLIYRADKIVMPGHPNCRCAATPVLGESLSLDDSDRSEVLNDAYWTESQEQVLREYAKANSLDLDKARERLNRARNTPTPSEAHRTGSLNPLRPAYSPRPKR